MQHPFFRHDPHGTPGPHFSPILPQVELEIVRGTARFRRRPVDVPVFLIGTAADCDLVLGDPQFAEVHTYLLVGPQGVSVRHLGFAPNLSVNGKTVHAANLTDGDRLRLGTYEFRLRVRSQHKEWLRPVTARKAQHA